MATQDGFLQNGWITQAVSFVDIGCEILYHLEAFNSLIQFGAYSLD